MWSTTPAANTLESVGVQWFSEYGPNKLVSDNSSSNAYPAHVDTRPPKDSTCGFWSLDTQDETAILFSLESSVGGALCDITCLCCFQNVYLGQPTTAPLITIVGGTGLIGNIAAPYLDLANGTPLWSAVGWANVT